MNSVKKSNISYKEILLLAILVLLLGFYAVSKGPLQDKVDELNGEISSIQSQIDSIKPFIEQMNRWNKELDQIFADANGSPVSIPDYDNFNGLVEELSDIFDHDTTSYAIAYGTPSVSDSIATRELTISYSCNSYDSAVEKLENLDTSDTRFRIKNVVFSGSSEGGYSVNINVVVFEYANTQEGTKIIEEEYNDYE